MSYYSLIVGAIVGHSSETLTVVDRRQSVTVPFPNARCAETEYCLLHAKFCSGTAKVRVAHDFNSLENALNSVFISTTTIENFKLVFVLHVNSISEIALLVSSTSAIIV